MLVSYIVVFTKILPICRSGYIAARLQDLWKRQTINTRASTDTCMSDNIVLYRVIILVFNTRLQYSHICAEKGC